MWFPRWWNNILVQHYLPSATNDAISVIILTISGSGI